MPFSKIACTTGEVARFEPVEVLAGSDDVMATAESMLAGLENSDRADALAAHLFDETGILVNSTREKGLERFIRFSLSVPEHNDLLIDGVRGFLDR